MLLMLQQTEFLYEIKLITEHVYILTKQFSLYKAALVYI